MCYDCVVPGPPLPCGMELSMTSFHSRRHYIESRWIAWFAAGADRSRDEPKRRKRTQRSSSESSVGSCVACERLFGTDLSLGKDSDCAIIQPVVRSICVSCGCPESRSPNSPMVCSCFGIYRALYDICSLCWPVLWPCRANVEQRRQEMSLALQRVGLTRDACTNSTWESNIMPSYPGNGAHLPSLCVDYESNIFSWEYYGPAHRDNRLFRSADDVATLMWRRHYLCTETRFFTKLRESLPSVLRRAVAAEKAAQYDSGSADEDVYHHGVVVEKSRKRIIAAIAKVVAAVLKKDLGGRWPDTPKLDVN